MIKYSNKKVIEPHDWDELVTKTYGRPYIFQQQDGCKDRGTHTITIPEEADDSEWSESVPDKVNGEKMGVKFSAWLARDPKEWNGKKEDNGYISMFWERNFYPDVQMIANDLHKKGLIEAGEYTINIDW